MEPKTPLTHYFNILTHWLFQKIMNLWWCKMRERVVVKRWHAILA